jgi:signal transduction histidine kinase
MRIDNKQEELNTYLDMMEKSITRSESFISQIVSYSKNKRMDIHHERLDILELINEVFENHRFVKGNERIVKEVSVVNSTPFYSDRNRLTIIFNNLISNAIRYADPEKETSYIKINISINEDEAIIEFADNGIGIGEEHVAKIFDMFYRANTNSKGSGLGLFLFKETLKRLKGFASVESTLGKGTQFFMRIPNFRSQAHRQQELLLN